MCLWRTDSAKDLKKWVLQRTYCVEEELEIEEETFYYLQDLILNSRDQITKVESRELDVEEQPNVGRSTHSRKGRKQDVSDCFLYYNYDDNDIIY